MTTQVSPAAGVDHTSQGAPLHRAQRRAALLMVLPYVVFLGAFGVLPALYIVYLAFTDAGGMFANVQNFVQVASDFRYVPALLHIVAYSAVFIVPALVIAIGISLVMRRRANEAVIGTFQMAYYLPQALIGAAGVVVWLFLLTPAVSPFKFVLEGIFGFENIIQVVDGASVVATLALIAVWTSGNAILLMYAALRSVPQDLIDAARIDGVSGWQMARYVELPLLRKWVAYTVIINFAAAMQVFAEPQLMSTATSGGVGANWSPLQLAYTFAYQYVNFNGAAALALQLLILGLGISIVVVRHSGLFKIEI